MLIREAGTLREQAGQKDTISYSFDSWGRYYFTVLVSSNLVPSPCPSLTNHAAIESPDSSPPATSLPQVSSSSAGATSQPRIAPERDSTRIELEQEQQREQPARQEAKSSGNKISRIAQKEAANGTQGLRMMQIKRGASGSRRGRGAFEILEL